MMYNQTLSEPSNKRYFTDTFIDIRTISVYKWKKSQQLPLKVCEVKRIADLFIAALAVKAGMTLKQHVLLSEDSEKEWH